MGANGRGKSTLLRFIAARRLPVPQSVDVLLVDQAASFRGASVLEDARGQRPSSLPRLLDGLEAGRRVDGVACAPLRRDAGRVAGAEVDESTVAVASTARRQT